MSWLSNALRVAAVVAAAPEIAHGLASQQAYGNPQHDEYSTEAIIVLGCPTHPDGSLHPLQKWRVDIAARTMNQRVKVVVFTGTTAKTGVSEASAMAAYARARGIPGDLIILEEEALSTWQNLEFTASLVEHHDDLRLVPHPPAPGTGRQAGPRRRLQTAGALALEVRHHGLRARRPLPGVAPPPPS